MASPWALMLASASKAGTAQAMAAEIAALSVQGGWTFEFKFDGIRALIVADHGSITIVNRRGVDITYRYPDVVEALTVELLPFDVVIDGEIVCPGADGLPDFHAVHRRDAQATARDAQALAAVLPAQFIAFDILAQAGVDLRARTYLARRAILEAQLPSRVGPTSVHGSMLWAVVEARSMEGLIAKRNNGPYLGRRSVAWVKFKRTPQCTALVRTYEPGRGFRAATFGALNLLLLDAGGREVPVGKVGTGFTQADGVRIRGMFDAGQVPFAVEVAYMEYSPNGRLRMPSFRGLRTDVAVSDCTLTQVQ